MAMLMQTLSLSNSGAENGLRDPSFSSYLTGAEQSFVLNVVTQCKADDDDGDIGVFSADKYFNGSLGDEKPKVSEKPVKMVLPHPDNPIKSMQLANESRDMSVRSGSSGNSQSALLQRVGKHQSFNGPSKVRGRGGYFGSVRCKCVCSDKNSVAVEEYESSGKTLTLNQRATKEPIKKGISPVNADILGVYDEGPKRETYLISEDLSVHDLARKSLEVFGMPVTERRHKPLLPFIVDSERKLRHNWEDGSPKPVETVIPMMGHRVVYAESDSDASSDFFEIEDFSTGKVNPFLSRQVSRNMSGSATPKAGYAPSEASIAWSVVTASAADFPIASEYEELKSGKNAMNGKKGSTMAKFFFKATGKNKPKRLSSSLLACNSQDSVTVVDHARKTHEKIPDQKILNSQYVETHFSKPKLKLCRQDWSHVGKCKLEKA